MIQLILLMTINLSIRANASNLTKNYYRQGNMQATRNQLVYTSQSLSELNISTTKFDQLLETRRSCTHELKFHLIPLSCFQKTLLESDLALVESKIIKKRQSFLNDICQKLIPKQDQSSLNTILSTAFLKKIAEKCKFHAKLEICKRQYRALDSPSNQFFEQLNPDCKT